MKISDKLIRAMTCEDLKFLAEKLGFKFIMDVECSVKAKSYEFWGQSSHFHVRELALKGPAKTEPIQIDIKLPKYSNAKSNIQKSLRDLIYAKAKLTGQPELYWFYTITKMWMQHKGVSHT